MARAKHTDRADARRRHRLAQATEPEMADDLDAPAGLTRTSADRVPAVDRAIPPRRPGILAALQTSYHQPHVREDVAALPPILRSRAFILPVALVLGSFLAEVIVGVVQPANAVVAGLAATAFQFLAIPPAMFPVFIAGFLTPRASYLLGGIIGTLSAVLYGVALVIANHRLDGQTALSLVVSAASGVAFGAAAAWYKRFLASTNPNRNAARNAARGRATGRPASSSRRR